MMMTWSISQIPLQDLLKSMPNIYKQIVTAGVVIGENEKRYAIDAISNMGNPNHFKDYIDRFERLFAEKIGVKYAFAVVNGTAALHLGLLALGVGNGDEVILPDMTYVACANVISYTGAKPVFADIDPESWTLDPKSVKKYITKRTKAIMPVWMYGSVPDMDGLKSLGIPIIEDSCPAFGSYDGEKHAGTIGDVGAFSLQGAKVFATGEGGILVTNSEKINAKVRKLADMGITDRQFWHDEIGYMYEMAPILAAVGLGQLEHADEMVMKKVDIFRQYFGELSDIFPMNKVSLSNYWMSSIITPNNRYREKLREYLKENGIDTRPFFYPISMFPMYKKQNNPISYDIGLRGINLPSRVDLTENNIQYIIRNINEFHEKYKEKYKD